MSKRATATVNGVIIADANTWHNVEGNIYFPPTSLKQEYFKKTHTHTKCPWKGKASYYTIQFETPSGEKVKLKDAAWFYPEPLEGATYLKDHVAFYKNKVEITVQE